MKAKDRRALQKMSKLQREQVQQHIPPSGMKAYQMVQTCGCCYTTLFFSSDEKAIAAVEEHKFMVSASIADETGKTYDNLDTFYGIWLRPNVFKE